MLKILVTGGAGFIGSHLVDGFLEAGHEVVIVDNLYTGRMKNVNSQAIFYLLDIRSQELEKVFQLEGIDAVCHQAAQMDVRKSVENPQFDAQVNILGTLNLLQNCIQYKVKKFLFASTGGAIYGEQQSFPCDENHPTQPVSPYGITKLSVEKYLHFFATEYGLCYCILRYANVYGPRQNPHGEAGVVAIFTKKLLEGIQPIINGDGKQTRDYVFVQDVVRANILGLSYEENDLFNIGTGIETDVNTLFHMINEFCGKKAKEQHGPSMPGEQLRSVISYQKAEKLLSWKPEVVLKNGIQKTVQHFKDNQ
jgi:UDP-glucose 4-epimerase